MARKRSKGLKGLGLTAAQHKGSAKSFGIFFADAVSLLKRDLQPRQPTVGACRSAIAHLEVANRAAGALFAHQASRGAKKARRAQMVNVGLGKTLKKLRERYIDVCIWKD